MGPSTEPCGTEQRISQQPLKASPILTLGDLSFKKSMTNFKM